MLKKRSHFVLVCLLGLFLAVHSSYADDVLDRIIRDRIEGMMGEPLDDPRSPSAAPQTSPPPRNNNPMDAFDTWNRYPNDLPSDEELRRRERQRQEAEAQRRRQQAGENVDSRLNQSPDGRRAGRPRQPLATELDEMLTKLEWDQRGVDGAGNPFKLKDVDRKRLTAYLFYHQDVYRNAVLDGTYLKDSPRVKIFLELKKEMQMDVIQRMGIEYKRKTGLIPKQPVIPFDYNNILSDDDIVTGTGKVGRELQEAYKDALSKVMEERIKVPMTAADRARVDVSGLAWNMTQEGALVDFHHPEKYINPQSGMVNQEKLIEGARQGKVSAYTFDHNGKLVKLDAAGTEAAIKRLNVDVPMKIPGIDPRYGAGAMSDFLRLAEIHKVKGTQGLYTLDDVAAFIRNQKYTERTFDVFEKVFAGESEALAEFTKYVEFSRRMNKQTTVINVAEILQELYDFNILDRAGGVDWEELTKAMAHHQNRQLNEILPMMIQKVSRSEAGKIAEWYKTASAASRRLLRKRMALTYAPMDPNELRKIADSLDALDLDPQGRQFLKDILVKDTKQIRTYAEALEIGVDELASRLSPDARTNMAVVDFIKTNNAKVRSLTRDLSRRKGGLRFQNYLFEQTGKALNMDVMLDQVTGPRIMQASLFALFASRAYGASRNPVEGYKQVLTVGLEMVPFCAAILRTSEGEYKDAFRELAMDVFPPFALAQLAGTLFDYGVQTARNRFDEAVWDGHVREMLRQLDDSQFEKKDFSHYYLLKDRNQVFNFLAETAAAFGTIAKLASLVEPEVEARLERTEEYKINRKALSTLQWFYTFDEETLKGKLQKRFDLKQLRARVYEQGVPGVGEDPTVRVAAKILADELRLRKDIYDRVLHEFIDRIEKKYNELKQVEELDPSAIVVEAMAKLKQLYDDSPPAIWTSDWGKSEIEAAYRSKVEYATDYNSTGKDILDVQRDMQAMLNDFRRILQKILAGIDLFREQRYLDLQVLAYGGVESMVAGDQLLIGDTFRLGIRARVQPRRRLQRWTVYYYVNNVREHDIRRWTLLGQVQLQPSQFNPRNDGLWVIESPEPSTFYQVTEKQLLENFRDPRGYYQVRAVLAFGDWPEDPVSRLGWLALQVPMDHYELFNNDRAAYASSTLQLWASPPRPYFRVPQYVYLDESPTIEAAVGGPAYLKDEKQKVEFTVIPPFGGSENDVKVEPDQITDLSSNPERPSRATLKIRGGAEDGTYQATMKVRMNRILDKYQPFTITKSFTLIDQHNPNAGTDPTPRGTAGDGLLTGELNKIIELHEGGEGLVAHARLIEGKVRKEINAVASEIDRKLEKLIALESRVNALSQKASDIGGSVAAAQRRAEAAYQAAERAAAARSEVQSRALDCCTLAEQAKQSDDRGRINELISQARLEDDQARSGKTNYETHLAQSKIDLDSVLSTKTGLEYFAGDQAKLRSEIQAEASGAGLMTSDVERLRILADEIIFDKNSLLNVIGEAGIVLEGAEKKKANRNLSPNDEKRFKQIREYHGKIVALKTTIEGVYQSTGTRLNQPAQRVSRYNEKLGEIRATFDAIGAVRLGPQALADLNDAAARARSSYDAAGVFEDSVNDSVQKSSICLRAAEEHLASIPDPLTARQSCENSHPGSVPTGERTQGGGYVCDCPQGTQWNDPNNKTHCVASQPQLSEAEICSRDVPGSIPGGGRTPGGQILCVCPSGMEWQDPVAMNRCVPSQPQLSEAEICSRDVPGSIPGGGRTPGGQILCVCPSGMEWQDPNNKTRCVRKQVQRTPDQICHDSFPNSVAIGGRDEQGRPYCGCPSNMQWNDPVDKVYCIPNSLVSNLPPPPSPGGGQANDPRCNGVIQQILNAQFVNDRGSYDRNMAYARQIGCQVPPEVSGWKASQGGWTGPRNPGGQTGSSGGTSAGGASGGGRGCVGVSTGLLGQGESAGCIESGMPTPRPPPPGVRLR